MVRKKKCGWQDLPCIPKLYLTLETLKIDMVNFNIKKQMTWKLWL